MEGIPENVLEHFKTVRTDTGISISRQMKMYENGYKVVKVIEVLSSDTISIKGNVNYE